MSKKPKILYAIQGTGNGHVARALEIVPMLKQYAQVDVLLSGNQSEIDLPFTVDFQKRGLVMLYSKRGGVSFWKTLFNTNLVKLFSEVFTLPVKQYDLVVNDFEFTSAWACRLKRVKCVGVGHQASFISEKVPLPEKKNPIGATVLKHYAPANAHLGYHFDTFDSFIKTPVIRNGIRQMQVSDAGHYTVYLPAFQDEKLLKKLKKLKHFQWQVFSKQTKEAYISKNVSVFPVSNTGFIESFRSCHGVLTSAGFETPAEALFLGKKLFVIPIRHQYEQYCNAEALKTLGIPVVDDLKKENLKKLKKWCKRGEPIKIDYPDTTEHDLISFLNKHLNIPLHKTVLTEAI